MEISITNQFYVTFCAFALGTFLGAIYDVIRIWRAFCGVNYGEKFSEKLKVIKLPLIKNPIIKSEKQHKIAESILFFITDIIYFLIVTIFMIIFIYYKNDGIVRWYIFLGAFLGLILYYFTLGKAVIFLSEYIIFFLKVIFTYVLFFITFPFAKLFKKIKNIMLKSKEKKKLIKEKNREKPFKQKEFLRIGK